MESGGKEPKHDSTTDKQVPLPPLSDHEIGFMQKADISTGWDCLQLLLLNPAVSQRLGSREELAESPLREHDSSLGTASHPKGS